MTFTVSEFWCGFVGATVFWGILLVAFGVYVARKPKTP